MEEETVDVVFRHDRGPNGAVFAVFPAIPDGPNTVVCYAHIGQHGAMCLEYLRKTRPATEAEYAPLKRELEAIGYRIRVVKRCTAKHRRERSAERRSMRSAS